MLIDCIFFEETYEELPWYRHCTHSRSLFKKGEEDNIMCHNCRLWDAYIPTTATQAQVDKAKEWQNMSLNEQPDYHEYFGL